MTPVYILLCGASLVLNGTVLYWPSERFAEWLFRRETNPGLKVISRKIRKIMRWIHLDSTSRLIYRAGLVVFGVLVLAIGVVAG
jgi:hypothetical protein